MVREGLLHNLDFEILILALITPGKLIVKVGKSKTDRCKDVLEMIHTDICGPFTSPTMGGYRNFIIFIDDFSRFGYVELIREKLDYLRSLRFLRPKLSIKRVKGLKW